MKSLDEAKVLAGQLCGRTRIDVDVYEFNGGFNVKHTYLRKSKKYVLRATHKVNTIEIRDEKGKLIDSIKVVKEAKVNKEEPKAEQKTAGESKEAKSGK